MVLPADEEVVDVLDHQADVLEASEPYLCLLTGLGAGKTWTGARWAVRNAVDYPLALGLVTANSYRQLHDVVVPELMRACDDFAIDYTWRKGDANLTLNLGDVESTILCRTTEATSVNKIRGVEVGWWWGDEVRDATPYAVGVVFGRLRSKHVPRPCYLWTTTPNGFDHVYQRHGESTDPNYRLIRAKSDDNPYLTAEYLEDVLGSYDEQMARQERMGEFVSLGAGNVYRSFDREANLDDGLSYEPRLPLELCVDYGAENYAVAAQEAPDAVSGADRVHALTVHRVPGVYELAADIAATYPGATINLWDDSAMAGARSSNGRTWRDMLEEGLRNHGCRVTARLGNQNPPVVQRIASVNAGLRNSRGESLIVVNSARDTRPGREGVRACEELIKDFEQVVWEDNGSGKQRKTDKDRTHAADAFGYFIHGKHAPSAFRREKDWQKPGRAPRSRRVRERFSA